MHETIDCTISASTALSGYRETNYKYHESTVHQYPTVISLLDPRLRITNSDQDEVLSTAFDQDEEISRTRIETQSATILSSSFNIRAKGKPESGDALAGYYLTDKNTNLCVESTLILGADGLGMDQVGLQRWKQAIAPYHTAYENHGLFDLGFCPTPDVSFGRWFNSFNESGRFVPTIGFKFKEYVQNISSGQCFTVANQEYLRQVIKNIGLTLQTETPLWKIRDEELPRSYTATAIFSVALCTWGTLNGQRFSTQQGITSNGDTVLIINDHVLRVDSNWLVDQTLSQANFAPDIHHDLLMKKAGNVYSTLSTFADNRQNDDRLATWSNATQSKSNHFELGTMSDGIYNSSRDMTRPQLTEGKILDTYHSMRKDTSGFIQSLNRSDDASSISASIQLKN